MDVKIIKNSDGYFNLSLDRSPSITMVSLERCDIENLRDALNEMLKNESIMRAGEGYIYECNSELKRIERL